MAQEVNINCRMDADLKVSADPFYSEQNIRYLEKIARDVAQGKAHFSEHEILEVDD